MLKSSLENRATSTFVGLDEAGRGCMWGPVCVAGVVLSDEIIAKAIAEKIVIKDSKKMTAKSRNKSAAWLVENALWYKVVMVDNEYIDKHNILDSTMRCMTHIINQAPEEVNWALIDGGFFRPFGEARSDSIDHISCVIGGDNKYYQIAAASILAKTTRDEWCVETVRLNPWLEKYGIASHMGYINTKHVSAVIEHGFTNLQRKSYNVKAFAGKAIAKIPLPIELPSKLSSVNIQWTTLLE